MKPWNKSIRYLVDFGVGFGRPGNDDNVKSYAGILPIRLDKDIGNGNLTMINSVRLLGC